MTVVAVVAADVVAAAAVVVAAGNGGVGDDDGEETAHHPAPHTHQALGEKEGAQHRMVYVRVTGGGGEHGDVRQDEEGYPRPQESHVHPVP